MTEPLRDKFYGYTTDEWISRVAGELSVDAVNHSDSAGLHP